MTREIVCRRDATQDCIHKKVWKQILKFFSLQSGLWTRGQGHLQGLQIFVMIIEFKKVKVTQLHSIFVLVSYTVLCHRDVITCKFRVTYCLGLHAWNKLVAVWVNCVHLCIQCVMLTWMNEWYESMHGEFSGHERLVRATIDLYICPANCNLFIGQLSFFHNHIPITGETSNTNKTNFKTCEFINDNCKCTVNPSNRWVHS